MKKLNYATKYTIFICIGLVVFNLVFGYVLIRESSKAMITQINERMLDISNTAAAMIDGDALAQITVDDLGSPEYQKVMDTLSFFQENTELEYIYCIMQVGEKDFVYGVDPTIENPSEFGSHIDYTDALYIASLGTAAVDDAPTEDEWGEFYSSYSPVFDSKGDVAGIVAADFGADWYQNKIRRLVLIVTCFIGIAIIASVTLAILIASQYKKLFTNLVVKMNDLSNAIETLIDEVSAESNEGHKTFMTEVEDEMRMNDAMNVLGEKICVMQMRLATQIEIIRAHAYIDGLTGMNNRTSYMQYLEILEHKMAEDSNFVFSVVVFDINQLKVINDDYGHETGDKLIVAISHDIRDSFGGNRIYRVGGDEFVAILDDPDPSNKIIEIKGVIDRKNKESPIFHNPNVEIGLSVGAATYDPAIDRTYAEVFNRADNAMYADKREFYKTHEDRRKRNS